MRKLFQSFYLKLAVVFLAVLLVMALIQIALSLRLSSRFINKVDQQLNINLARDMAFELNPLFQGEDFNWDRIGERIHYMMVINPKIEIYVLDGTGKILAFFAEPGKEMKTESVDLVPIHAYLKEDAELPILGLDPRDPTDRKPFSAARTELVDGQSGYIYIIIGSEQYDQVTALFRENFIIRSLILGLIISVLFAGVLGLILFARMTRRIRTMSEFAIEFQQENYSARVPVVSNDEISRLGTAFNAMADRIVHNMEELKSTDSLRRELIANVSHDLRSPLAAIQGYIETIQMKEDTLSREERQQFLEIIHASTLSLSHLVHELFDLSKLEAHQIEPNLEQFSLAELVNDVSMKYQNEADLQEVALLADLPGRQEMVVADIALLERVLSNLIVNAIEHTPAGGTVTISLSHPDESRVRVAVSDTGPGIAEEDLEGIFERYYRGQRLSKRKKSSTGLGLSIAAKIIEYHNSRLLVKNQDAGGAEFHFDLKIT